MPDVIAAMRQRLEGSHLHQLFVEDLGWDNHRAAPLVVASDGINYVLTPLAEKHGMVAYECQPGPTGAIPDYATRRKIERQVTKTAHEHIIVFRNADKTVHIWQWVRRERGRPAACREHTYFNGQPGDSLMQKLQAMAVSLDEEENLSIVDVTGRVRQAFDVDRVTKRFYERFKDEHAAFLSFVKGIQSTADREWYASLMLNRLMFIYFIQKKRFLDGDPDYLRNRLQMVRERNGPDKFHSFYRQFLLRLFHEGLGQRQEDRAMELVPLLGEIPYLNGGLFDEHQLERDNPDIQIPDDAFEKLFDFFDAYQWHLDERPTRADNEINPDVLGYIFEKYINQKQMGAYYTKEDITEYISKSTIVPFLFDAAQRKCAIAFAPEGAVWRLLRDDPDRYIYDAVLKGVDTPLPDDIADGVSDVSKRTGWNRAAEPEFALPTETWREHVARRTRCLELRAKLAAGEVASINDLITYNLDLRRFAQDAIENSERPELLRAFWRTIEEVSVLDPTCGSGAFLFAALNILEPLYEACLDRMEAFVEELDKSGEKHHPEKFSDFRGVLDHANDKTKHPSLRYFILKSIVLNNLYGVDIMEEAVEICKLRLFLKLVAQVHRAEDVEPLPDIDFNIRAGNTLVGFTSLEAVRQAMTMAANGQRRMLSAEDEAMLRRIEEDAEVADWAFQQFKESQSGRGMDAGDFRTGKELVRESLAKLRDQLDRYLAAGYGVEPKNATAYEKWRASHQPFHWFVEFYGIMHRGGFDVAIGNPPFVEYSNVRDTYTIRGYDTEDSGNLYAFVMERSLALLRNQGRVGLISPVSLGSTQRMVSLREWIQNNAEKIYYSSFADRPSCLFTGVHQIISICILRKSVGVPFSLETAGFNHWWKEEREHLFARVSYVEATCAISENTWGKYSVPLELGIIAKIKAQKRNIASYFSKHGKPLAISGGTGGYWLRAFDEDQKSNEYKGHHVNDGSVQLALCGAVNSTTFYWLWRKYSDCRHLTVSDMSKFHFDFAQTTGTAIGSTAKKQLNLLKSTKEVREGKLTYEQYRPAQTKPSIDEIDCALAKHYGFTDEELDFIINYDIKYRMGQVGGGEN